MKHKLKCVKHKLKNGHFPVSRNATVSAGLAQDPGQCEMCALQKVLHCLFTETLGAVVDVWQRYFKKVSAAEK